MSVSKKVRRMIPACLPLALAACMNLPQTGPQEADVLRAAREVIAERYPQSTASEKAGYVIALSPVTLDGAWKTKKQISVVLVRNYTGAYEPVVRVRKLVASNSPVATNPEAAAYSYTITEAVPFAMNEWTLMDDLPLEEQEIYDAILAKLALQKPSAPPGPPVVASPASGA
jgi:hypothetical protein